MTPGFFVAKILVFCLVFYICYFLHGLLFGLVSAVDRWSWMRTACLVREAVANDVIHREQKWPPYMSIKFSMDRKLYA